MKIEWNAILGNISLGYLRDDLDEWFVYYNTDWFMLNLILYSLLRLLMSIQKNN
jgi:hypothetical protein